MILPSDFNLKILIAVMIAIEKLIRINRTLIEIFQADFTLKFFHQILIEKNRAWESPLPRAIT